MQNWTTANIPSQAGRLAIVTGATGGLGFQTALELGRAGAEVVIAGRNPEKGRIAVERIQKEAPGAAVRFGLLDLASLTSVLQFAEGIAGENRPLDLLVNNAGVMQLPRRTMTSDGFETQFATNHLGHFALTSLLLQALRQSGAPRVVNVSSIMHRFGKIDFANLQGEKKYSSTGAYNQSKLANLLFTQELQQHSDDFGWGLLCVTAHPGYARTDLVTNGPGTGGLRGRMIGLTAKIFSHSAEEGALPILFAATSPDAAPNGYFGPDGFQELKGAVGPSAKTAAATDKAVARRLWGVSVRLTGAVWPS